MRLLLLLSVIAVTGCSSWPMRSLEPKPRKKPLAPLRGGQLDKAEATNLCLTAAKKMEQGGNDREAAALYERARHLDADAFPYARRLAVLYDRLERAQQAEQEYKLAVNQSPEDVDLLNDFGVFHLRRERWPMAESWFRRALTVQPGHQRAAVNLAVAMGMQGRLDESFQTFTQVIPPAAAYSNIGVLLARQGRSDEARQHFRRALAIDQSIQPAGEFLVRLEKQSRQLSESPQRSLVKPVHYLDKR